MDEERRCGTCIRFDPESGVCEKTAEIMTTQDGQSCEWWGDWEMEFYGRRKVGCDQARPMD